MSTNNEFVEAKVAGHPVTFLIDSGSPICAISHSTLSRLMAQGAKLFNFNRNCSRKFFAYGADLPLTILATFRAKVDVGHGKPTVIADFFVFKEAKQSLLGKSTAEALGILKVGLNINLVANSKPERGQNKTKQFPKVPNRTFSFTIDDAVKPHKSAYFRVPVAVESLVDTKLDEMLNQGIIEHVHEASDWISPLHIVPKGKNDIRICVNMKRPNEAIKRIEHPLPIFEDYAPKLGGAKIFSRLDIKSAYLHLELDEKSRHMTTFFTRRGLMRYTRLMFGVNCAPEMFQQDRKLRVRVI